MFFRPDQSPWAVFSCEFSTDFVDSIVTCDPDFKIVGLTDIKATCWILNHVHPEHRSLAPEVGFEPTTNRLTADRSTTELLWIAGAYISCIDSLEATANRLIPTASGLYH